jgi:hypothetical protein
LINLQVFATQAKTHLVNVQAPRISINLLLLPWQIT